MCTCTCWDHGNKCMQDSTPETIKVHNDPGTQMSTQLHVDYMYLKLSILLWSNYVCL